jgi:hypothetical protein
MSESKRKPIYNHVCEILAAQGIKFYGHDRLNWRDDLTYFCRIADVYQTFIRHKDELVITINPMFYELDEALTIEQTENLSYTFYFEYFVSEAYKQFNNLDFIIRNATTEFQISHGLDYTENLKKWGSDAISVDDDKDGYRQIISKIKENLGENMYTLQEGIRSK